MNALTEDLAAYVRARVSEFDEIPADRKESLETLALHLASRPARLTFICTHNSRRSHIAQLWAHAAADVHGIDGVTTYSGGTEATAFDPRAVAALARSGFRIEKKAEGDNPVYLVRHRPDRPPTEAFSKVYDQDPNPSNDFCAVMTCSQADSGCPFVPGASLRVAIPYEDPKAFDGTERESAAYDERCRQISREMLYLFSRVR